MRAKSDTLLIFGIAATVLLWAHKFELEAQNQFKAEIEKIVEVKGKNKVEIKGTTKRVQYRKEQQTTWNSAHPELRLALGDVILVLPQTYTKLSINTTGGEKATFTHWLNKSLTQTVGASYRIEENVQDQGYWGLFLNYGSLVADKIRGKIHARSEAMEVIATGTRYYMHVDPEDKKTTVFVDEGSVLVIAGTDTLHLGTFAAATALPGQGINILKLTVPQRLDLAKIVRVNHTEFWKSFKPWWQNWYVAGAGAALLATGIAAALPPKDEDPKKFFIDIVLNLPE
ncbi:hypothetical protein KC799_22050 [candidate division KSB1 bacterium]|nr:hypothetical protein [candidate division KSB1 bacterium]